MTDVQISSVRFAAENKDVMGNYLLVIVDVRPLASDQRLTTPALALYHHLLWSTATFFILAASLPGLYFNVVFVHSQRFSVVHILNFIFMYRFLLD